MKKTDPVPEAVKRFSEILYRLTLPDRRRALEQVGEVHGRCYDSLRAGIVSVKERGWDVIILVRLHNGTYSGCELFWNTRDAWKRKKDLIKREGFTNDDFIVEALRGEKGGVTIWPE